MTYLPSPSALRQEAHLMPVGKPAPPRPRRPDLVTSSMISSGFMVVRALTRARVAADADVVVDAGRIELEVGAEKDRGLVLVEGNFLLVRSGWLGLRILDEQPLAPLRRASTRLLDNLLRVGRRDLRRRSVLWADGDDRPVFAETEAAGDAQVRPCPFQAVLLEGLAEGRDHVQAPGRPGSRCRRKP